MHWIAKATKSISSGGKPTKGAIYYTDSYPATIYRTIRIAIDVPITVYVAARSQKLYEYIYLNSWRIEPGELQMCQIMEKLMAIYRKWQTTYRYSYLYAVRTNVGKRSF